MDLRERQRPLKERYKSEPEAARITLRATGSEGDEAVACSIDIGRLVQEAEAHAGVGGPGTGACSGDLLLGALAACAQLTCQMVATSIGIHTDSISAEVEGNLDLRGTFGVSREAPVGFEAIRLRFRIDAPDATEEQLAKLISKTERYCTVLQTLRTPPPIEAELVTA
ncbi:MAG: OsmC family protein [Solirubrobacterales bacterium]